METVVKVTSETIRDSWIHQRLVCRNKMFTQPIRSQQPDGCLSKYAGFVVLVRVAFNSSGTLTSLRFRFKAGALYSPGSIPRNDTTQQIS